MTVPLLSQTKTSSITNNHASASENILEAFVSESKGNLVIKKILIANNGIAAVKFIKSVREWLYSQFNNDKLIKFCVMATPDDLVNNCDYIKMADQYIKVAGGTNSNNFANVDLIVDCCERIRAQAVWAGWGHASENPELPKKLAQLNPKVAFLGPKEQSMYALGDKIASTIVAQAANVPTLPWSGSHLTNTYKNENGYVSVTKQTCLEACIQDLETGLKVAHTIGYPIMIKASEGGGGKGIRRVDYEYEFQVKYEQVKLEVKGSPIFIMKLADKVRHLEVQVFADQYGNAMSIFGRDCSVQRRHQKIIEEAPYIIASPETLEKMELAATRLAKLVGYESAGTVEYLYDPKTDKFYFLELNPRLQVEHPTTEMVSGINLPASQVQVAMGIPLYNIKDIRQFYNIKEDNQQQILCKPKPKGHVIAVRITAENPEQGFKPSGGSIVELNFRSNTNCWGYFSVSNLGGLHEYADTQFGHIFAKGETREECRKHMVMALKNLEVRSEFRITNEYIIKLLETEKFIKNEYYTNWLDELLVDKSNNILLNKTTDSNLAVICGALYKATIQKKASIEEFKRGLNKGLVLQTALKTQFNIEFVYQNYKYKFFLVSYAKNTYRIYLNGSSCVAGIKQLKDGGYLVLLDYQSHTIYCTEEAQCTRIMIDGETCTIEEENDPTQLRASSNGKIVKTTRKDNDLIHKNECYCDIEVMKMLVSLLCPIEGYITYIKPEGSQVKVGEIIAVINPLDRNSVKTIEIYPHQLPALEKPYLSGEKVHQRVKQLTKTIKNYLNGFEQPDYDNVIQQLFEILRSKHLEILKFELLDLLSIYSNRLPNNITVLKDEISNYNDASSIISKIKDIKSNTESNVILEEFNRNLDEISSFLQTKNAYISFIIEDFINDFYDTENLFECTNYNNASDEMLTDQDIILALRNSLNNDFDKIYDIVYSHNKISFKNKVMLCLLNNLITIQDFDINNNLMSRLQLLASLKSKSLSQVAIKTKEILISCHYPKLQERLANLKNLLNQSIIKLDNSAVINSNHIINELSTQNYVDYINNDTLQHFIFGEDKVISNAALEVYIRKAYNNYKFISTNHLINANIFQFKIEIENSLIYSESDSIEKIKYSSFKNLSAFNENNKNIMINGYIAVFDQKLSIQNSINDLISFVKLNNEKQHNINTNIIHIAINEEMKPEILENINNLIKTNITIFKNLNVKRLTVMPKNYKYSELYTFRDELNYNEDMQIRHIEPATAYKLELVRLSNFEIKPIFVENKQLHFYLSVAKQNIKDKRFFIRTYIRPEKMYYDKINIVEYLITKGDRLLNEILDSLEILFQKYPGTDCNHLFINFLSVFDLSHEKITSALADFITRHGSRLWKLRITEAEIRFLINTKNHIIKKDNIVPIRFIINNYSGFVVKTEVYKEDYNQSKNSSVLISLNKTFASRHLQPILTPYQPKDWLQPRRFAAHQLNTDYVYDYPELFKQALSSIWEDYLKNTEREMIPEKIFSFKELILDENNTELKESSRPPGLNTCGMVAFLFEMFTPDYPDVGREIIVISNDITYKIGSFGPQEDLLFYKATQFARSRGIPRIFLSANSGARLGISEKIRRVFKVKFINNKDPSKGFEYFYLTEEDYNKLEDKTIVNCEYIKEQNHYKINYIIGEEDGIGVECLKGSGLIAGETSKAYRDIFTITLVTARSVGIGAYLARLGQRVVQNEAHPIILTGYAALNKILGNQVYTSNLQIGGPQIMYSNGISHQVCRDNFEGIKKILIWLTFVPRVKNTLHGYMFNTKTDTVFRKIDIEPQQAPIDPRIWLDGSYHQNKYINTINDDKNNTFYFGFFDKSSFVETMQGWAKNVICGRARLGGIPVGVIAVETRTQEAICPADPSDIDSQEKTIYHAPQVWYPSSAMKTQQAINDFNNGEQLPLFIFANWRGFSGGQRDMFNEILKFGSYIVDALSTYNQPVFTYIVPNGELRGGAWAVLDSTINSDMIEMYADRKCRGGIIEKEGLAAIKYRHSHILDTISRLDPEYKTIKEILESDNDNDKNEIEKQLKKREKELYSIYTQIALHYVDLHDRPERMVEKDVVKETILEWSESRIFFYWRLKRRVYEENALKIIMNVYKENMQDLNRNDCLKIIEKVFKQDESNKMLSFEKNDEKVANWIEKEINTNNVLLNKEYYPNLSNSLNIKTIRNFKDQINTNRKLDFCLEIIKNLPQDQKCQLLEIIKTESLGNNSV